MFYTPGVFNRNISRFQFAHSVDPGRTGKEEEDHE
jgi:hypothetical protein